MMEGAASVFTVADDGGVEWVDEGSVQVSIGVGEGLFRSRCRERNGGGEGVVGG